jgi:hypothetical protein
VLPPVVKDELVATKDEVEALGESAVTATEAVVLVKPVAEAVMVGVPAVLRITEKSLAPVLNAAGDGKTACVSDEVKVTEFVAKRASLFELSVAYTDNVKPLPAA